MGCMVAPAISVSHECNFGNGCPMTIKQAVSGSRFFNELNPNKIAMFLLQVTEPYNSVETGNEDWIIALILIGVIAFYILLCVLVGRYAKKHSRSFWGFFLLSFFLSPFWGFIIAIIAGGETAKQREKRIRQETEIRMQMEEQYRQQYYQTPPPMPTQTGNDM